MSSRTKALRALTLKLLDDVDKAEVHEGPPQAAHLTAAVMRFDSALQRELGEDLTTTAAPFLGTVIREMGKDASTTDGLLPPGRVYQPPPPPEPLPDFARMLEPMLGAQQELVADRARDRVLLFVPGEAAIRLSELDMLHLDEVGDAWGVYGPKGLLLATRPTRAECELFLAQLVALLEGQSLTVLRAG